MCGSAEFTCCLSAWFPAHTAVVSSKQLSFPCESNQASIITSHYLCGVPESWDLKGLSLFHPPKKWCQSQENVKNDPLFCDTVTSWMATRWLKMSALSLCPISSSEHPPATCVIHIFAIFTFFCCHFSSSSCPVIVCRKTKQNLLKRIISVGVSSAAATSI